jgi:hypothetical protein
MNIKRGIFLIIALLLFLSNTFSNTFEIETGVWVDNDCEMVRTQEFCIIFNRIENYISATYYQFAIQDSLIMCKSYGKVIFSDTSLVYKQVDIRIDSIISEKTIGKPSLNSIVIEVDNIERKLRKIENIQIVPNYEMFYASSQNVGDCIRQWQLGSRFYVNEKKDFIKLTITTNMHSYIFSVSPETTYCRAARIKSNNSGTLFAQNIRLWHDKSDHNFDMYENNDSVSSAELNIDNSLFQQDACTFDKGGIYWSLVNFNKKKIKLNGCGGQIYYYRRIPKESKWFDEWIKYE